MSKRGIGSVVGSMIIVLISIVAISILFVVYFKTVGSGTSGDASSCFGIDVEVKTCFIISPSPELNYLLDQDGYPRLEDGTYALLMNLERHPGGKDIKNLTFAVTDYNGRTHVANPIDIDLEGFFQADTDYSDLIEYNSVDAVVRDIPSLPKEVAVSVVVGESNTICRATREVFPCKPF